MCHKTARSGDKLLCCCVAVYASSAEVEPRTRVASAYKLPMASILVQILYPRCHEPKLPYYYAKVEGAGPGQQFALRLLNVYIRFL